MLVLSNTTVQVPCLYVAPSLRYSRLPQNSEKSWKYQIVTERRTVSELIGNMDLKSKFCEMASRRKANQKNDKAPRDTCCVSLKAVQDGKDDALLCEGQCQNSSLLCRGHCGPVQELSSSQPPFSCFTCGRTQHQQEVTELRSEVEVLRVEL